MQSAAAALCLVLLAQSGHARDRLCLDDAPVCLEAVQGDSTLSFSAENQTAAPYSVRVVFDELENLKSLVPLPLRAVLKPSDRQVIGKFARVDPEAGTHFHYRFGAALGSSLARQDRRFRYRMPFGGSERRVLSQGVGGRHSHSGPSKWSFDFAMPWGTPVLAARAGTVVEVVEGQLSGGTTPRFYDKANRVTVLHTDGTLAMYAHLRHGAVVSVGEAVKTGDLLGFSGDTGYSTGPHLHFMVWKRQPDLTLASVPIRFHDGSREGVIPSPGLAYAPACGTSGEGCAPGEKAPTEVSVPAAPAAKPLPGARQPDGACECANGAVIHVDLPCGTVCGG